MDSRFLVFAVNTNLVAKWCRALTAKTPDITVITADRTVQNRGAKRTALPKYRTAQAVRLKHVWIPSKHMWKFPVVT